MTLLRPLFGLCLALMLALTSMSMAEARHYGPVGTSMVICAGGMTQTVILDADGHKVPFTHVCPDCVMGALDMPVVLSLPQRPNISQAVLLPVQHLAKVKTAKFHADARGPPDLM